MQRIYDRLYDLEFLEAAGRRVRLLPGHEVVDMQHTPGGCDLALRDRWGKSRTVRADAIVLGTGSSYALPGAMQPFANRMSWDRDGFPVRADFSVEWDGPPELRSTRRMRPGTCEECRIQI